jgi:hypothetical protein
MNQPITLKAPIKCVICGRMIRPGELFWHNAHARLCSFKCTGHWNRLHNVNYAWTKIR